MIIPACTPYRNVFCTREYAPVCANSTTYNNMCLAESAGFYGNCAQLVTPGICETVQSRTCTDSEFYSEKGFCVQKPWSDIVSCEIEKQQGACPTGTDPNSWVTEHCAITCNVYQSSRRDDVWRLQSTNYERLILRRDACYEGKRTKNILKCKRFADAEYIVQDADFSQQTIKKDGREITLPMLSHVSLIHKEFKVSVASGFKQQERLFYYKTPDKIIRKMITVKYFEETQNKNGSFSLRYPIVKYVHNISRI